MLLRRWAAIATIPVLTAAAFVVVSPTLAHADAAVFHVTSAADEGDSDLSNLKCDAISATTQDDLGCTLRAAVEQANKIEADQVANSQTVTPYTIIIDSGVNPVLGPSADNDTSGLGEIKITAPMTIQGQGSGSTTVSWQAISDKITATDLSRIFHVATPGAVTITGLTGTGGNTTAGEQDHDGGCLLEDQTGDLTLTDVAFKGCKAVAGGGLYDDGGALHADGLTLGSTSAPDVATTDSGGGAFLDLRTKPGTTNVVSGTTISLKHLTVSGNLSQEDGAGVYVEGDNTSSSLTISDATFDHNETAVLDKTLRLTDGFGGGLALESEGTATSLSFSRITFTNNTAHFGGAIYDDWSSDQNNPIPAPTLRPVFTDIVMTGNTAASIANQTATAAQVPEPGDGGAVYSDGDGSLFNRLAVASNTASGGGGGLYFDAQNFPANDGGVAGPVVENATITANTAATGGGIGVGAAQNSSSGKVLFSTIAGNSATGTAPSGGGISVENPGDALALGADVLSGNTSQAPTAAAQYAPRTNSTTLTDNCAMDAKAQLADLGYNDVFGGGLTNCSFSGTGDSTGDPKLQALASNGGFVQTMALPKGSAAVDLVPTALAPASALAARAAAVPCGGGTDARGNPRPAGPACDAGAFEAAFVAPTPTPTAAPTGAPAGLISPPATGGGDAPGGPGAAALLIVAGLAGLAFTVPAAVRRRR